MTRVPIVFVTGFLGSGKTTLLQRLAAQYPQRRIAFLVNEFAPSGVDAQRMALAGQAAHSVVGGSLFCQCKAGEFIQLMRETIRPLVLANAIDTVVIETSGMADPGAVGTLMDTHGLADFFHVAGIVTVVAPAAFLKLMGHLPVVEAQIRASDQVVLNKIDISPAGVVDSAESAVRAINPRADIVRASYCDCPLELADHVGVLPAEDLGMVDSNPFVTMECHWPEEAGLGCARERLGALPDWILRIKGSLLADGRRYAVDRTVDSFCIEETTTDDDSPAGLVFIAHEDNESSLAAELRGFGLSC